MGSAAAAAAATPPQFLSISSSSSSSSKFSLHSADHRFGICRKNWNWNDSDGSGRRNKNRKKKTNLGLLCIKAYKRIPMETPGAYQLVDDKTGDKVIIWGGADDDDHSHRQQALSWKPEPQQQEEEGAPGIGGGDAAGASDVAVVAEGGSLRSFARLKAPKVKELIRKKSSEASNTVTHDASRKIVADRLRRERNDDEIRVEETKKLPATVIKQPQDAEEVAAPEYVHASAPRAAPGLRGWGRAAASVQSSGDILYPNKHQRKMSVDSGFFSRKTYKELGCTGDMIESLRSLSFLRPSHIQVMPSYANGDRLIL